MAVLLIEWFFIASILIWKWLPIMIGMEIPPLMYLHRMKGQVWQIMREAQLVLIAIDRLKILTNNFNHTVVEPLISVRNKS